MPSALQFVYAMLALIADSSKQRMLIRGFEDLEKEAGSVVVASAPWPEEPRSTKRKREIEENGTSSWAVSLNNLMDVPPKILVSCQNSGYRDNSTSRKLKDVTREIDATAKLETMTEQDLKPQHVKIKRGQTSGNRAKST